MSDAPVQPTSIAPPLEIAHVVFLDIVGFSKLPLNQQHRIVELLQSAIRASQTCERAAGEDHLVRIPTGDGAALVFFRDPTTPVLAAFEIAQFAAANPELRLRIGVHSGPVYVVEDMNGHKNVTGSGINIAQRIMDCGDAGHILASQAVAEVLLQLDDWSGCLEFLGEAEVKHEVLLPVYKLSRAGIGNEAWPSKLVALRQRRAPDPLQQVSARQAVHSGRRRIAIAGAAIVLLALLIGVAVLLPAFHSRSTPFASFTVTKLTDSGNAGVSAISPDGNYLVYLEKLPNGDGTLKLKHLPTGSISTVVPPQNLGVYFIGFTPDGNYVVYSKWEQERFGWKATRY